MEQKIRENTPLTTTNQTPTDLHPLTPGKTGGPQTLR